MFHNCADPFSMTHLHTDPFSITHLQNACPCEKALPIYHFLSKAGACGARIALAAIDQILSKCDQILTKFDQNLISFGSDLLIYKQISGGPLGSAIAMQSQAKS